MEVALPLFRDMLHISPPQPRFWEIFEIADNHGKVDAELVVQLEKLFVDAVQEEGVPHPLPSHLDYVRVNLFWGVHLLVILHHCAHNSSILLNAIITKLHNNVNIKYLYKNIIELSRVSNNLPVNFLHKRQSERIVLRLACELELTQAVNEKVDRSKPIL